MTPHPKYPIVLSILAALTTLALKTVAYRLTDSVSLLSDAAESLVNLVAAGAIAWYALGRFIEPKPLEDLGTGALIAFGASLINLVVGLVLLRVGRATRSIVMEADGKHLLTDVWTSAAVLVGLGLVTL